MSDKILDNGKTSTGQSATLTKHSYDGVGHIFSDPNYHVKTESGMDKTYGSESAAREAFDKMVPEKSKDK